MNTEDTDHFCDMCDKFQKRYGSIHWINIVYISLIACVFLFILSLLLNAPLFCWAILLGFIFIWIYFNQDVSVGLFLLALFLLILFFSPTHSGHEKVLNVVTTTVQD